MGTTRDAIRSQTGVQLCYVLCIEGYKYLISDAAPALVETAWAASIWNDCLTGLEVSGSMTQHLRPWSNDPSVPAMTFSITGDTGNDQFATDVFRRKPTNRTELTVGFDTGDSSGGGFNMTVKKATLFTAGSVVHVGTEAFLIGTPSGVTIPVAANGEGYYHPFSGNVGSSNRIPQPHNLPPNENINTFESNSPVWVSDEPTNWVGKKVALYVHRISGGVLDVLAEAELWFAGTIDSVVDNDMTVDLQCVGIQQSLMDAEVMSDQWVGTLKDGFIVKTGDMLRVRVVRGDTNVTVGDDGTDFICGVSSGFSAGRYTALELGSALANHLNNDSELGEGSTIALRWSAAVSDTLDGMRWILSCQRGTTLEMVVLLIASNSSILNFLGFDQSIGTNGGSGLPRVHGDIGETVTEYLLTSDDAPLRYGPIGTHARGTRGGLSIALEGSDGTYVEQTSYLPAQAQEHIGAGESWGIFLLGEKTLFLARKASDTSLVGVRTDIGLPQVILDTEAAKQQVRVGDGRSLRVRQVLMLTGSFYGLIARLFASVDGNGANHATYDVFPFGAGIPWGLLGNNFINSLQAVEQAGAEDAMTIIVEKPTKLWDILKSEFVLRMAGVIWKDGGLQIAQLGVPSAATADHVLDETNKSEAERTVPTMTSEFQCTTLKIQYNRWKEQYGDEYIVRSQAGYENAGKNGKTKTIKARNSYAGVLGTGSSVEALGDMLGSRWMPVLAKPLNIWTRSIPHTLFHMCPGDTVSLTDDRVRNPNTGARGVTSRACTVLSVSTSFGISSEQDYHGSVDLIYSEEDRTFGLSPSAEHAPITSGSFTSGWNAGGVTLLLHEHKFSNATDATDGSYFTSGTIVRITEADPSDPSSADSFLDELDGDAGTINLGGTDYDTFSLINGFGAGGRPAFDSSKTYIVNYASYDEVLPAQQLYAYQCDDADGEILDTIDPNLCGDQLKLTGSTSVDLTLLPSRYAVEQYGDGVPLSASFVRDQIRMANALVSHRTGNHFPMAVPGVSGAYGYAPGAIISGATYIEIITLPVLIGAGLSLGTWSRVLKIAPQFSSTDGASASIRITSAANPPFLTSNSSDGPQWSGPKKQVVFTTTSTTDYTVATAQDLEIVRAEMDNSLTWITIEGTEKAQIVSLNEAWLQELAA